MEENIRYVEGIMATDHKDNRDDIILVDGMKIEDPCYVCISGRMEPKWIVGIVTEVTRMECDSKPALYVKASLFPDSEAFDFVCNTLESKPGALTWDPLGQIDERDEESGVITKSTIKMLSLTRETVDDHTYCKLSEDGRAV